MISTWFNFFKTDGGPTEPPIPFNPFSELGPVLYFHPDYKVNTDAGTWTDIIQQFVATGSTSNYNLSDSDLGNSASLTLTGTDGFSGFVDDMFSDSAQGWTMFATFYKPASAADLTTVMAVHSGSGNNSQTVLRASNTFSGRIASDGGNVNVWAGSDNIEGEYGWVVFRYLFAGPDPEIHSSIGNDITVFASGSISQADRITIGSLGATPANIKIGHAVFFNIYLDDNELDELTFIANNYFLGITP